jgi:hypothetical protein
MYRREGGGKEGGKMEGRKEERKGGREREEFETSTLLHYT